MKERTRRTVCFALAAVAVLLIRVRQEHPASAQELAVQTALPVAQRYLIPGGLAVGVALKTQGVLVVAKTGGNAAVPLRVGDVILSVEGEKIDSAKALASRLSKVEKENVELSVLRGEQMMTVRAAAPVDGADGRRRLGVWVRDSTAGVGTLSYVDPVNRAYGALGHAIVDADTGGMLAAQDGAILNARVVGVVKGKSGQAGELRGSFLRENEQIGTLQINSEYGIYGHLDAELDDLLYPQGLPVGSREDVHNGPATIITTVDEHGPAEYTIEITRCFAQTEPNQKGMILRVTDERLIEKTGGIVQGMSGSPIIQDGKLIGAVTHVYLSDAARGYGMYIEWMLSQSDRLEPASDCAA